MSETKLFSYNFHIYAAIVESCPISQEYIHVRNPSTKTLTIKAKTAMRLGEYMYKNKTMDYPLVTQLIFNIGQQLRNLDELGFGIPYFSLDDIVVFTMPNEVCEFAFLNETKLFEFIDEDENMAETFTALTDPNDYLYVDAPMNDTKTSKNTQFISLEMKPHLGKLPFYIHYKSAFYSFGMLVLHCLGLEPTLAAANAAIHGTGAYWFVKRCMETTPEERRFHYLG